MAISGLTFRAAAENARLPKASALLAWISAKSALNEVCKVPVLPSISTHCLPPQRLHQDLCRR